METGIGKRDDGDGSGKKLVVKLKNWKPAPEIDRVEEIKTHYCRLCDKMFSSGKALGGHMSSAHVQGGKDYSGKKVKKSKEYRGSGDYDCGVCGKSFPSQKSLYGHMRCHPEREWRGMDPPGKRNQSSEASTEPDDLMEDAETANFVVDSMMSWSVKARRGRSGLPMIVSPPVEKSPQGCLPSRQQLVRLLKWQPDSNEKEAGEGTTSDASSSLKNLFELSNSCSSGKDGAENKKRKWDDCCCPYHVEKTSLIKRHRASPKSVDGKEESDTESDIIVGAICYLANGRIITPVVDARLSQEKHICNICNKVLLSHQALGGHKSSHTKVKVSIANTEDVGKNDPGNNITIEDAKAKEKGEDSSHVCQICRKWFPTARALGGHKKIHNNKGGRSIGIGEVERVGEKDFDLNMEPDENSAVGGGDESHVHGLVN